MRKLQIPERRRHNAPGYLDVKDVGMPELPEAETIARQLNRELAGRTLGKVDLTRTDVVHGDPRPLGKLVSGRRITRVHRRGKRIVIELDERAPPCAARPSPKRRGGVAKPVARAPDECPPIPPETPGSDMRLVFHLGMTGQLIICPVSVPIEKHTHLRISIRNTRNELRFRDARRFGGVWCLTQGGGHVGRRLNDVGPEPLELTPARFRSLICRPRRIKALLMDQRAVAGLGNIYCDEALHAARLHPLTTANEIDSRDADRLLRAIKSTLRLAIRHKGSTLMDYRTASGATGSFQKYHRVYQRAGKPCRSCGTPVERVLAAGRSTFLCPSCQPLVSERRGSGP